MNRDNISANASALRRVGRDIKASSPDIIRGVRREIRNAAREVAGDARNKSGQWSTRIPDSIKITNSGLIAVIIRAGGASAPHAAPYENRGKIGKFRHPLNFPNQGSKKHWVDQNSRPFLHPAYLERWEEIRFAITAAVLEVVKEHISETKAEARRAGKEG